MTVIIGILCENGVVIGSDSSMTFIAGPQFKTIEQEAKKVFTLGDDLIFATTGAVGLAQRFQDVLSKAKGQFKKLSELDAAKLIAKNTIQDFADTSAQRGSLGALVAYNCAHGLRLVEFAIQDFQPELKTPSMWFSSMGSGQALTDPFLAFIKRVLFGYSMPKLNEGVFATYWALLHAIDLNTGGILGPPQNATLTKNAAGQTSVKLLSEQDFGETKEMVDGIESHLRLYREKLAGRTSPTTTTTPAPQPPK